MSEGVAAEHRRHSFSSVFWTKGSIMPISDTYTLQINRTLCVCGLSNENMGFYRRCLCRDLSEFEVACRRLRCACSQKSAKLTAPNGLKAVFIYLNSAHVIYRVQLSGDSGFESPAGNYISSLPSCWPNGKAPDYGALFLPRRLFIRVLWSLSARAKGSQGWRTSFSPSRGKSSVVHLSALFKLVLQLC